MNKDLTHGAVAPVLIRFTIPLFISVIFQQVYSLADSMIVGQFAGEEPLAAIGVSYPIVMIFMAVALGGNIGCSVTVSHLFGSKNYASMKTTVFTALTSFTVISGLLTVLGALLTDAFLVMLNTPANIFDDASTYLRIYMYGFVFVFMYNVCTGVFTSLGDSKTPLLFLIGSSVCNIALDLYFVAGLQMGVAGAAWATFIAQGGAAILAVVTLLLRMKAFRVDQPIAYFHWGSFRRIGYMALPSIMQQSFVSVGNILIQSLINGYGSSTIAGVSSGLKLSTFALTCLLTVGSGVSAFTAQNLGAGQYQRIKEGFKVGVVFTTALSIPFVIGLFVFAEQALQLFLDATSVDAIATGKSFLWAVTPLFPLVSVKFISDNLLRGADAMAGFVYSTLTDLLARVGLSFLLSAHLGFMGIAISWPIGWLIGTPVSLYFYRKWNRAQAPLT
ncbi:MATE family efflux transporter [Bengtsoniella intestinalis]|uniref:MATE family efflux transporter n=1 Tax=Bengtsoniella intestinalis TaxID=3073143 RepID=UPI00391F72E1